MDGNMLFSHIVRFLLCKRVRHAIAKNKAPIVRGRGRK